MADVLAAIAAATSDPQPVFDVILRSAIRLCGSRYGVIRRLEGDEALVIASHGTHPRTPKLGSRQRVAEIAPGRRIAAGEDVVHIRDIRNEPLSVSDPVMRKAFPTRLGVALKIDGQLYGWLNLVRDELRPFSDHEIDLVRTFAAYAALAIKNVRLFNETKEALERQTATAEILNVIAASPADVQPVLDAIAENAVRFCSAEDVGVLLRQGDELVPVAHRGPLPFPRAVDITTDSISGEAFLERRTVHVVDVLASDRYPESREIAAITGQRVIVVAPLLKQGQPIGLLTLRRREPVPFTDRQIALLETFASQAVIAIENVRLFNETKEALEQQTAISEVLHAISASPTDVLPVLGTISLNGARLCNADFAGVMLSEGDKLVAHTAQPDGSVLRGAGVSVEGSVSGKAIRERRTIHVHDILATDEFPATAESRQRSVDRGGPSTRTAIAVPLLRQGDAIGTIFLRRKQVHPFSEREIALVETFARQAVIAIENVRLFNDTKEALDHQRAIAEILEVVSRSPSDVQPVLDAIVASAATLTDAVSSAIFRAEGDELVVASARNTFIAQPGQRLAWDHTSVPGTSLLEGRTVHVPDVRQAPQYPQGAPMTRLAVPIITSTGPYGALIVGREDVQPFTDRQIQLMETFARQAAIAIENVRLFNETKEALERQTATSEVLEVISRSTTDVKPVFQSIAERAVALTGAESASVLIRRGEEFVREGVAGVSPEELARLIQWTQDQGGLRAGRSSMTGRVAEERRTIQIDDVRYEPDYYQRGDIPREQIPWRTILGVPMLRGDEIFGVLVVRRRVKKRFTPEHVRLLETFAAQAVIALENVRLFNETKDALARQTATSEVLQSISRTAFDLDAVLTTVLENAMRLCGSPFAVLWRYEDGRFEVAVSRSGSAEYDRIIRESPPTMSTGGVTARVVRARAPVQIHDVMADPEYGHKERSTIIGIRTLLGVPLLRDEKVVGVLALARTELRDYTGAEIDLVRTFADQAAIAIENVRLFNETKEALERQTATSEVLKVISSSAFDLQPVLDKVAELAVRLTGADNADILHISGDVYREAAHFGEASAEYRRVLRDGVHRVRAGERGTLMGRVLQDKRPVHIVDVLADPEYAWSEAQKAGGFRTILGVPLIREGTPIGAVALWKRRVESFSPEQIALVSTFADQAVIAIENVRLFNETKEGLERQTAIAEILKAISGSPTDVQPVLNAIAENAARFCGAEDAGVALVREGAIHLIAHHGPIPFSTGVHPIGGSPSVTESAIVESRTYHVPDMEELPDEKFSYGKAYAREHGYRGFVAAPMLKDGKAIGAIQLRRREPGPFQSHQIGLVETFAAQAVIAIDNVRLFNETKEALEQQRAIADVLSAISRSVFDLDSVLSTIAERAAKLCQADTGSVHRLDGHELVAVAIFGPISSERYALGARRPLDGPTLASRSVVELRTLYVEDVRTRTDLPQDGPRTRLAVPIVRDGRPLGTLVLTNTDVRAFSERQIELVEIFADQAGIAIENVRLFNETKEALAQQTATSEVLQSISRTAFDLDAVLTTVLENAMRLCDSSFAVLWRHEDGRFTVAVSRTGSEAFDRRVLERPLDMSSGGVTARVVRASGTVHIHDVMADEEYGIKDLAVIGGYRTVLGVPLFRGEDVVGVLTLARMEVRDYNRAEIGLVRTFADQAAIAIENVRLFNETKEALERQTALAGILGAISESPTDVQPVLDAIAESATRFCAAEDATVGLIDGSQFIVRAHHGAIALVGAQDVVNDLDDKFVTGEAIRERRTVHVADLQAEADRYPRGVAVSPTTRAIVATPLLRAGEPIGGMFLRRTTPTPFTEGQISLVETFAQQAVIAIENVRLFNETKEALDRQTATAEVMKAINSSMGDLQHVLDQVIAQATRLAEAEDGFVYQVRGDVLQMTAAFGDKAEVMREWQRSNPIRKDNAGTSTGRAFAQRRTVHIPDVLADPTYTYREAQELGGFRVLLSVPMIRDGEPLGVLALWRTQPRPFTDSQIKIVELLADQALVAIENARLLDETKESLEKQTAVAEMLKTISRSVFDLDGVLDTVVENASRLSRSDVAWMSRAEGTALRAGSRYGRTPEIQRLVDENAPIKIGTAVDPDNASIMGSAFRDARVINVDDLAASQFAGSPMARAIGARSTLAVPLLSSGTAVGVLIVARLGVAPFTERDVQLVTTFADQAVIAIENVRLFNEIQDKSHQLEVASRHKSEFLANMSHELRTPLNAIIGFTDVMLQEMFGPLNDKQKEYLEDVRGSGTHLLSLINDILDLSKIEAGRVELEPTEFSLADAIENALTLVRERASRHAITLAADVSPDVGSITADERKVKQIVVNLLTNAVKFTPDGGWVGITAACEESQVRIAVRDTGIGIAPEDQDMVFEEFQQVGKDPERSREGTGLGLTLSKRFVELHGGRIWVESEVGKGSTFTFTIPVRQTATVGA